MAASEGPSGRALAPGRHALCAARSPDHAHPAAAPRACCRILGRRTRLRPGAPVAARARHGPRAGGRLAVAARERGGAPHPIVARRGEQLVNPVAVLTWDNGEQVAVYGRTVFGRDPFGGPCATVVVRDETLSLSRTHFEIGGEHPEVWLADRWSRNGTVLVREGVRTTLRPGERVALRPGDRLELGDRTATVSGPA
ncbi:FHA domain-containing protein [Microbacterium lushaniae]|nr:FHA domain-containing protein [Microbacterium lushaniae]